ncbi:MAG: DnaD domain protein [Lachnospiraceae bacterium]|nr:DnaD domain protein [Lachnospiraceae bacterium]
MSRLMIYKENNSDSVLLSNRFIDEYLADANDAQIKVYLYLLRMVSAHIPTSISDIADKFNHTERDVMRALSYWEKLGVITIEYDRSGEICGLQIPSMNERTENQQQDTQGRILSMQDYADARYSLPQQDETAGRPDTEDKAEKLQRPAQLPKVPEKRDYSSDELSELKKNEDFAQIVFATETYFNRPLVKADYQSLAFIYKDLSFSPELLEYLIEYCVGKDHCQMRYIEKVAIAWSQAGIKTVRQARNRSSRYEKIVYNVLKALGRNQSDVTKTEADYILSWYHGLGFSEEVILYACDKCVLATEKNRIAYTDGILKNWHSCNLKTLSQIQKHEEKRKEKAPERTAAPAVTGMVHNKYAKRQIDYDRLEEELLKYK